MVSKEFELATLEIEKVDGVVDSNDTLLQFYALFKIANGVDFASAPKPGVLNIKDKYKYNAWKDEVEKGTTAEGAEKKYIELVEAQKNQLGFDPTRTKKADNTPIDAKKLARFDELAKELGKYQ